MLPLLAVLTLLGPGQSREDARTLLERVVANQERNQDLQRQYTYVETVREEDQRKDGTATRRKEETFEVTPAAGGEYRRLVARSGQPLSPEEERKEEEKFQKYVEERLKLSPDELKDKNENLKRRVGRFESRIREALEVFEFTPAPDELIDGRPVRVFHFTPRKGYKPHSRATALLNRTEGTVWIDPGKNQIAKLYMRFWKDAKLAWGLFGRISEGTEAVAEQIHVGDDIWLMERIDVFLKGRFYFLKKYNRRLTFTYSDYKKYSVSTKEHVVADRLNKTPH
jgi:carboxylesterase type B